MSYIVDPLSIATEGFILISNPSSCASISIATMGFIVELTESLVIRSGKLDPHSLGGYPKKPKIRKRITATVYIDNVKYTESIEVDDINIKLSDVRVNLILEEISPRIIITLCD